MGYSTGRHMVLRGEVRLRGREIIRQVCAEMGVTIINGALSCDHVHMLVEIPPPTGREIQGPMAAVILDGLIISTVMSLLLLPVLVWRWRVGPIGRSVVSAAA